VAHSPRWAGRFPAGGAAEYPPGIRDGGEPWSFSLCKPDAAAGEQNVRVWSCGGRTGRGATGSRGAGAVFRVVPGESAAGVPG
jgi:hypothetical protein